MTVVATITVPAEEFLFDGVLSATPGVRIEFERVVPLGSTCLPSVRVSGIPVEEFDRALRGDPDIESFSIVDTVEGSALARIEWGTDLDGLVELVADAGGTVLEATGHAETWTLQLRFGTHAGLSSFYRQCIQRGFSLDVDYIGNSGGRDGAGRSRALSDAQRETLHLALERGYFEVPREITLQELAEELSISDTAVSQRLRRGLATLLVGALPESNASMRSQEVAQLASARQGSR